jgi:hypothetical protein
MSIAELEAEIVLLNKTVDELAEEGKYEEADISQKKLENTKKKLADAKKLQLIKDHENKQAQLREAYHEMEKKFSQEWDEDMEKFEKNSQHLIGLCLLE